MRVRNPLPTRSRERNTTLAPFDAEQVRDVHLAAVEVPTFPEGVSVGNPVDAPTQVAGVVATGGLRTILVEWDAVTGLQSVEGAGAYEVELDTAATFDVAPRALRTAATSAVWSDLATNTTYYARVRAVQGAENVGEWSSTASASTSFMETSEITGLDAALDDLASDLADAVADIAAVQAEVGDILPITEVGIADDSISAPKLKANSVTAGKIAADAVTSTTIAAGAVTAEHLAADSVTANAIEAGSITAEKLAAINLEVGQYIRSTAYVPGTTGYSLEPDGSAEFTNIKARGDITATGLTAVDGTENLLDPGTFEVDTEGWVADAATAVSRSSSQKHSGSWALKMSRDGVTFGPVGVWSPAVPIDASRAYRPTASTWSDGWLIPEVYVEFLDADDGVLDQQFVSSRHYGSLVAAWQDWSSVHTPPAGATQARIYVYANGDSGDAGQVYIDDVSLTTAAIVTGGFRSSDAPQRVQVRDDTLLEFVHPSLGTASYVEAVMHNPDAANEKRVMTLSSGAHLWGSAVLVLTSETADVSEGSKIQAWAEEVSLPASTVKVGPEGFPLYGEPIPYTPTWSVGGVTATVGNGTLQGWYTVVGNFVLIEIRATLGSTTNFNGGSGLMAFNLPFSTLGSSRPISGNAHLIDSSTGNRRNWLVRTRTGNAGQIVIVDSNDSGVTELAPWTWETGDNCFISATYLRS